MSDEERIDQANGYGVTMTRAGQLRPYGDTIHERRIRDIRGERTRDEVLAYCRNRWPVPQRGDEAYHDLVEHFISFKETRDGCYLYTTGHEYTG